MIVVIEADVVSVFLQTERPNCAKNTKFFSFKLGIFCEKLGKKMDILDWEWDRISTLVIGRKGPKVYFPIFLFLFRIFSMSKSKITKIVQSLFSMTFPGPEGILFFMLN